MIFLDYKQTGVIYHIISLIDLENVLKNGIFYDDKSTYKTKYYGFHGLIEEQKPLGVPGWVDRRKAIFASMNYPDDHKFHSHTAILAIKIDPQKCWVANENCANQIFEPYILQNIEDFSLCRRYIMGEGKKLLEKYWRTALSFEENLIQRRDKIKGYDAEILVCHPLKPQDIELKYIISDHRRMEIGEWKDRFCIGKE